MPLSATELAALRSHLAVVDADIAALVADTPAAINVASSGGSSAGSALVGMLGQSVGGSGGGATSVIVPPPPPASGLGDISSKPIDMTRALVMQGFMPRPDRYQRDQDVAVLKGNGNALFRVFTVNFAGGGSAIPFGAAATITLTFDGKPVATQNVLATDVDAYFTVDLSTVPEDWYRTSATGLDASWSVVDYAVYVMKGATALPQTKMPVVIGSYTQVFTTVTFPATTTSPP